MESNLEQDQQKKDINNIILDKLQELSNLIKRNEDNTKKELNSFKNEFHNELNQLKNKISNLENSKFNVNNLQEFEDVNIINKSSNIKNSDVKSHNSMINPNNIDDSQINNSSIKNNLFYKGIRHLVIKKEKNEEIFN